MAEGIQLASFNTKYFCHHCSREVSPFHTAELICPDCSSGFLEEVSKDLFSAADIYSSCPDDEDDSDLEDVSSIPFIPNTMDHFFSRMLMNVPDDSEENESEAERHRLFGDPSLDARFIRELANEDDEDTSFSRMQYRYLEDFMEGGDEEIDALASQLLDEVEISGPPPLSKDQIKSLTSLAITTDLLEKGLQCTVCMDDFSLKDKAKQLPCNHLYHEKCITPWLERQATCPNCREVIQVPSKSKRSRSYPRTRLSATSADSRRFSEASPLHTYFTSSRGSNWFCD